MGEGKAKVWVVVKKKIEKKRYKLFGPEGWAGETLIGNEGMTEYEGQEARRRGGNRWNERD